MQRNSLHTFRVIAFDPGYERLGVAVLEKVDGKEIVLFSSTLQTEKSDLFEKRLVFLGNEVKKIIETYSPTVCALEKLFFQKNQKTAMHVAEVRGMLLYLASDYKLLVHEYSPQQVKIAVTGHGGATKNDIFRLLPRIVALPKVKMFDDELDAISVGLTCLVSVR